jgi:predicted dehydrogenase
MNRRSFLKTSGAGLAGLTAASATQRLFAAQEDRPLRVALIGCGWYGKTDLFHLIQVAPVEVVGMCDVDRRMAEGAAELVAGRQASKKKPPVYGDYRKLLADVRPEIVLVGTPDHWHCLPTIDACKAGADVYVQKPVSYDVVEGQAMVAAARKYKRTVQVGLERRSTPHILEAGDRYIRSGKLGKIAYVDVHSYYGGGRGFPAPSAPPEELDWEMYVGPASWREYNPGIHPRRWRDCREFSNGQTGDLCVHLFDVTRMFLGLGWPRSIAATGGILMRDPNSGVNVHDTQTALSSGVSVEASIATDRFADALGLPEHELLGKVLFVLFKVVGDLGQFRNDRLGVGPVAEEDLHQLRCPMLAGPGILVAGVFTQALMPSSIRCLARRRSPSTRIESANISPLGAGSMIA